MEAPAFSSGGENKIVVVVLGRGLIRTWPRIILSLAHRPRYAASRLKRASAQCRGPVGRGCSLSDRVGQMIAIAGGGPQRRPAAMPLTGRTAGEVRTRVGEMGPHEAGRTPKLYARRVAAMDGCDEIMPERLSSKQGTLTLDACSVAVIDDCDELISKGSA